MCRNLLSKNNNIFLFIILKIGQIFLIPYFNIFSVYIEVGDAEGPIRLTIQTVAPESRLFSIKVKKSI